MGMTTADDHDFEQALEQVERSLQALKDRYAQVRADQEKQSELRVQLNHAQQSLNQHRTDALKAEVQTLKKQLDDLEIALESQLFSWRGLTDAFWQAIRFGGLGLILGWLLKTWAG